MADTITLEIESNGQITAHELPVEERDGRKVVRLVVDVQPAGGSGQVWPNAGSGGGARGGGGGKGFGAYTVETVHIVMSRGGSGGGETNR